MPQRLKWAAIAAAALLIVGAGAYRWPISSAFVAAEFGQELSKSVGLELRRPARAYLTILPLPNIQIVDVELRGRDGAPILTAAEAKARLALLPLLVGRFEFTSASLRQPTALIDLDHMPFARDSALATLIDSKSEAGGQTSLGALRFHRGLLHVVSAAAGLDTLIEDAEGDLEWPRLADSMRLGLRGAWRGTPLTFDAWLDEPAKWLIGGRSQGWLNLATGDASLKLDGALQTGVASGFEGALSAQVGSLSALARIAGLPQASSLPDGRLSVDANASASLDRLTLSDLRLTALAQTFEGALAFDRTPRGLSISGSLAAGSVQLDDLLVNAHRLADPSGAWSREPFSFGPFAALALDLRLSAARVEWAGHVIADAAFSLMSKDGGATATLSEADAYKGLLTGEASLAPAPQGAEIRVSASLINADIGALIAEFGSNVFAGQGDLQFVVQSKGDNPAAIARALSGDATIKLGPGIIQGLSFEEALRRSERRPIDLFADMRTGRTVFNEATARVAIEKGEARILSAAMIGPGVCVTMSGAADLAERNLAARLAAVRADQHGAPNPDGPRLDFTIAGPWSRPTIKSDTGA